VREAGQNGKLSHTPFGALQADVPLATAEKSENSMMCAMRTASASAKTIMVGALIDATSFDQS
jgi:hypothetical protein